MTQLSSAIWWSTLWPTARHVNQLQVHQRTALAALHSYAPGACTGCQAGLPQPMCTDFGHSSVSASSACAMLLFVSWHWGRHRRDRTCTKVEAGHQAQGVTHHKARRAHHFGIETRTGGSAGEHARRRKKQGLPASTFTKVFHADAAETPAASPQCQIQLRCSAYNTTGSGKRRL